VRFNHNIRPIAFEFSANGGTKRRETRMKKASYISGMPEIG